MNEERNEALSTLAGQIKKMAQQKRLLLAVFTRQMEAFAEKQIEEAVMELTQQEYDAAGWASF